MTKRSPLAPGDKVVFYNNGFRYHGEVVRLYTAGKIQVRSTNGNEYDIHEKQCRRPKPRKEKQERAPLTWAITAYTISSIDGVPEAVSATFAKDYNDPNAIRLVELRSGETICPPGSVSVSRMQVIDAWGNMGASTWISHLEELLRCLGLPKEGA